MSADTVEEGVVVVVVGGGMRLTRVSVDAVAVVDGGGLTRVSVDPVAEEDTVVEDILCRSLVISMVEYPEGRIED